MELNNIGCGVVRDLLPLYAENMTGDESRSLIEAHLPTCPSCQKELASLQTQPQPMPLATDSLRHINQKLRRKKVFIAVVAAFVVLLGSLCFMGFTAKTGINVTKDGLLGLYDHSGVDLQGNDLDNTFIYINVPSSFEACRIREVETKRIRGEMDQIDQVVQVIFFTCYETVNSRWRNMQCGNQGSIIMLPADNDMYQSDPNYVYSQPQESIEGVTAPYPGQETAPQILYAHTKTTQIFFVPYTKWDKFEQLEPFSADAMAMATLLWDREADEYDIFLQDVKSGESIAAGHHVAGTPLN